MKLIWKKNGIDSWEAEYGEYTVLAHREISPVRRMWYLPVTKFYPVYDIHVWQTARPETVVALEFLAATLDDVEAGLEACL